MLRYAGGKQRAIKKLSTYIPDGTTEVISPFMGGCSFEISLAKKGIHVFCNDVVDTIVNYFKQQQEHPNELLTEIRTYLPITKETYLLCKRTLTDGTRIQQAAKLFVVNRSCFSGCMSGGFSGARFTESCVKQLDLQNMEFFNQDYEQFLADHPNTFAYLDPPYDVKNLYLADSFDHERLARVLRQRTNWVMSYNDTPLIRKLYGDWCDIEPVDWVYCMTKFKKSNEVIIRAVKNESVRD
jgi:DNA adenine methylase